MKTCIQCQVALPLDKFHSNGSGYLKRACGPCEIQKRKVARHRRKLDPEFKDKHLYHNQRKLLDDAKSVPCMDCGVEYAAYIMDFDHRPEHEKLFNISTAFKRAKSVVLAEIAKCDIVCSNCHRERTYVRRNSPKSI